MRAFADSARAMSPPNLGEVVHVSAAAKVPVGARQLALILAG